MRDWTHNMTKRGCYENQKHWLFFLRQSTCSPHWVNTWCFESLAWNMKPGWKPSRSGIWCRLLLLYLSSTWTRLPLRCDSAWGHRASQLGFRTGEVPWNDFCLLQHWVPKLGSDHVNERRGVPWYGHFRTLWREGRQRTSKLVWAEASSLHGWHHAQLCPGPGWSLSNWAHFLDKEGLCLTLASGSGGEAKSWRGWFCSFFSVTYSLLCLIHKCWKQTRKANWVHLNPSKFL